MTLLAERRLGLSTAVARRRKMRAMMLRPGTPVFILDWLGKFLTAAQRAADEDGSRETRAAGEKFLFDNAPGLLAMLQLQGDLATKLGPACLEAKDRPRSKKGLHARPWWEKMR